MNSPRRHRDTEKKENSLNNDLWARSPVVSVLAVPENWSFAPFAEPDLKSNFDLASERHNDLTLHQFSLCLRVSVVIFHSLITPKNHLSFALLIDVFSMGYGWLYRQEFESNFRILSGIEHPIAVVKTCIDEADVWICRTPFTQGDIMNKDASLSTETEPLVPTRAPVQPVIVSSPLLGNDLERLKRDEQARIDKEQQAELARQRELARFD